jgi:hypothetical protein
VRKLAGLIVTLFVAAPALAEEAVVAPPKTGSPFWDIIGYLLGIVLVPVMGLAVKLIYEWQAKLAAEKGRADLGFKEKLKHEVEVALARIAANIANKQLAELKTASKDGTVSKEELKKLGKQAIDQAKGEFRVQGIDIAKRLGEEYLESQLRNLVDKSRVLPAKK